MIARSILTSLLLLTATNSGLLAMPGDGFMQWLGIPKPENPATIKVLIGQDVDGVVVAVTGGHNLYNPADGRRLGTRFMAKSALMKPTGKGLCWGEEFPELYQVMIKPDGSESSVLVDGTQIKGDLYIYQVGQQLFLVNELGVEDYLASTLCRQFPEALPSEAMNAVVITARTRAAYHVNNATSPYWHVNCRDVDYKGYAVGVGLPHIQRAVEETKGLIMLKNDHNGRAYPFVSEWTEHCAGQTIPYHVMYREDGNAPDQGAHSSFAHRDRDRMAWKYQITKQELAQLLGVHHISGLKVYADKDSNKVYAIRMEMDSQAVDMDFKTLQKKLGKQHLLSSDFSLVTQGDEVIFSGVGMGTGVGLCLYSATEMARRGQDASQILARFFPKVNFEVWKGPEGNPYRQMAGHSQRPPRHRHHRNRA